MKSDGYPYRLPQPAGAITYQLNGAQVGRGNTLNIEGSGITAVAGGDKLTYVIGGGGGGLTGTGAPGTVAFWDGNSSNLSGNESFTWDNVQKVLSAGGTGASLLVSDDLSYVNLNTLLGGEGGFLEIGGAANATYLYYSQSSEGGGLELGSSHGRYGYQASNTPFNYFESTDTAMGANLGSYRWLDHTGTTTIVGDALGTGNNTYAVFNDGAKVIYIYNDGTISFANPSSGQDAFVIDTVTKDVSVGNKLYPIGYTGSRATFVPITMPQSLTGAGAANVTTYQTQFTSDGGAQAISLGSGLYPGQLKKITYFAEGGFAESGVITPSPAAGYSTVTINGVGSYAEFIWQENAWVVIDYFGATVA